MHATIKNILELPLPPIVYQNDDVVRCIHTASGLDGTTLNEFFHHFHKQGGKTLECEVNLRNCSSWTPLMYGAYLNNLENCQLLIRKHAKVNTFNSEGKSPLSLAAVCGHEKIVQFLISCHANINNADESGKNILSQAICHRQFGVAELLLKAGANPNIPDLDGNTPTLYACKEGTDSFVMNLIDRYGGNVNHVNKAGNNGEKMAAKNMLTLKVLRKSALPGSNHTGVNLMKVTRVSTFNNQSSRPTQVKYPRDILKQIKLDHYLPNFDHFGVTSLNMFLHLRLIDLKVMEIDSDIARDKLMTLINHFGIGVHLKLDPRSDSKYKERVERKSGESQSAKQKLEAEIRRLKHENEVIHQEKINSHANIQAMENVEAQFIGQSKYLISLVGSVFRHLDSAKCKKEKKGKKGKKETNDGVPISRDIFNKFTKNLAHINNLCLPGLNQSNDEKFS
uniref:ANK_REP_REGION domain-containing protein n=1 Tax=Rhabditophanes sp. KR3021 TaxID=114890 RepID=A0AC35U1C9_9BILA